LGFLATPAKPQYIRARMYRSINDVLCQKKVCQELNIIFDWNFAYGGRWEVICLVGLHECIVHNHEIQSIG
jgi:hypothetical protein